MTGPFFWLEGLEGTSHSSVRKEGAPSDAEKITNFLCGPALTASRHSVLVPHVDVEESVGNVSWVPVLLTAVNSWLLIRVYKFRLFCSVFHCWYIFLLWIKLTGFFDFYFLTQKPIPVKVILFVNCFSVCSELDSWMPGSLRWLGFCCSWRTLKCWAACRPLSAASPSVWARWGCSAWLVCALMQEWVHADCFFPSCSGCAHSPETVLITVVVMTVSVNTCHWQTCMPNRDQCGSH